MSTQKISLTNYEMLDYKRMYTVVTPPAGIHLMPHMHWHPQYEIMLIRRGNYVLRNNHTVVRHEGVGVFIHCPYSLHNLNTVSDHLYERDLVLADRSLINSFAQNFLAPSVFASATLLSAFPAEDELDEMRQLAHKAADCRGDNVTGALYIAILLRRILSVIDSGRGDTIRTDYSYIQDVLRYVSENLSAKHTLQSVALRYTISVSKLQRDFTSALGTSFHNYLTALRQSRAREMISAGESIVKVSLECGYCSESHFIKAFREYWGYTPRRLSDQTQA